MSKKITFHDSNKQKLNQFCEENGYEITWLNEYGARVFSGVCIVDIWTPRMKFFVWNIDGVEQPAKYGQMSYEFDKIEVKKLLEEGRL